jgi:hypothetical protein
MQFNTLGFYSAPNYYAYLGLNNGSFYLNSYSDFVFGTSSVGNGLIIKQNGNILINTGTDAGFRLDVNGTARVQGNLNVSTGGVSISGNSTFADTTTFSSAGAGIRCSTINPLINQNISISASWAGSENVTISTITNKPQVLIVQPTANLTLTSGTHDTQRILHTFAPTSGTAVTNALTLNQTINQTGGANGITRGLYIAPTLTAAADFRAIETTAGNVIFNGGNVGIGTTSPATALSVTGSEASGRAIQVRSSAGKPFVEFFTTVSIGVIGSATAVTGGSTNDYGLGTNGNATANLIFGTGAGYSERMRIFGSTGNIGINTTTDAGFRLDVNGDTIFRRITNVTPNTITGGTQFFTVKSGNWPTALIRCFENGNINLGSPTGNIGFDSASFILPVSSTFNFNYLPANQLNTFAFILSANYTNLGAGGTSEGTMLRTSGSTSTSVGTVTMNQIESKPTYNNTGGTTINRGFYYNPILTSMTNTTHYAIHSTSGRVRLEGLPTSSAGLSAGDIWNDGGTLKIV